ncbi:MAG: sigma-70 family RNA polymerase sigma factor [Bacteroidales bacterium]|jgi:RNA polymerase sigma-70 factor (ECF subfamily)|nr:sigma-70 family RNA polymerase sigma factor [Bacteroidales bacterium]
MPSIFLRKKGKEENDEMLLKRFRDNGDIESLGLLYQKYMHLVYGVCLKYLESREEAKDEVMNIFERLVSAVPGQEIGNFRTWLYVVTKNHCLMLLRSRKSEAVHREMMLNDPTFFMEKESLMHPLETDTEPDTVRLRECIEKLKDEQKKCIELFYYEGYGYKKICDRLGMEEKRVKSYIQNGKRNLRLCLEKEKG